MQIRRLILYGRRGGVRTLDFELGALNIITGGSKTGKSAIIEIVDYCLGAKKCYIPDGAVRDGTSHYAIAIAVSGAEVFICRPDPPANQEFNDRIWVVTGDALGVPDIGEFTANFNPETLKQFLSERVGIAENASEPSEGQTRTALAANFRHALVFTLQDQNEVEQRDFLFHDTGNNFEHQAVQDTLPYFLGSIDENRPKLRAQLREAVRQQRLAERRLEEFVSIGGAGLSRGQALVAEARQAQLLGAHSRISASLDADEIRVQLQAAVDSFRRLTDLPATPGSILAELDGAQERMYERLQDVDSQLRQIAEVESAETGFAHEVREQQNRLAALNLMDRAPEETQCPVCGAHADLPNAAAAARVAARLEKELAGAEGARPRFSTLRNALTAERGEIAAELRRVKDARSAALAQDAELRRLGDLRDLQAQCVGRLSLYLESGALDLKDDRLPLEQAVAAAEARVNVLRSQLETPDDDRFESALSIINRDMTRMAVQLNMEYREFLRLDPDRLLVIADTRSGPVPMNRMGSGENWMMCHLIAHLALHGWFVREQRPVPNFLIFDQLSQVYFPTEATDTGGEDWDAVRRTFKLILDQLAALNGGLQVIAMEHVELQDEWFQAAIVQRWRDGVKLIPSDWIEG